MRRIKAWLFHHIIRAATIRRWRKKYEWAQDEELLELVFVILTFIIRHPPNMFIHTFRDGDDREHQQVVISFPDVDIYVYMDKNHFGNYACLLTIVDANGNVVDSQTILFDHQNNGAYISTAFDQYVNFVYWGSLNV